MAETRVKVYTSEAERLQDEGLAAANDWRVVARELQQDGTLRVTFVHGNEWGTTEVRPWDQGYIVERPTGGSSSIVIVGLVTIFVIGALFWWPLAMLALVFAVVAGIGEFAMRLGGR